MPATTDLVADTRQVIPGGGQAPGSILVSEVLGSPEPSSDSDGLRRRLGRTAIRAFDAAVAGFLLLVLAPVILVAILAVRLESPGPAFIRVNRVGHGGRRLRMLKFRKMHDDAAGPALTVADDERFTRMGKVLARLKLDEVPQLWNVLRGEMSLVGPRPDSEEFVALHSKDYREILSVRPGITGLSQIAFAEESAILDEADPLGHYVGRILPQKVLMDKMYAYEQRLWLNLRILFWTTAAVLLRRQVAVHRDSGKMNLRKR
jgi:lipopolysaccharide/colanic/teichoic acid biosynthesis glycosyltransferase